MAVVMVAAEQTGFSSGAPNDDDVCFAARGERNKNFLIKSLTCASRSRARGRFVSFFVETRWREKEREKKTNGKRRKERKQREREREGE